MPSFSPSPGKVGLEQTTESARWWWGLGGPPGTPPPGGCCPHPRAPTLPRHERVRAPSAAQRGSFTCHAPGDCWAGSVCGNSGRQVNQPRELLVKLYESVYRNGLRCRRAQSPPGGHPLSSHGDRRRRPLPCPGSWRGVLQCGGCAAHPRWWQVAEGHNTFPVTGREEPGQTRKTSRPSAEPPLICCQPMCSSAPFGFPVE